MGDGEIWDLSVDGYANYWTGVVNANSGKSTSAAAMFASACTGIPIIGPDEKPLPRQFNEPNEFFTAWVVGWDQRHIGETIYRLLFKPGLFKVIWHPDKQRYVTYNDNDPECRELAKLNKPEPAEPLIPPRYVEGMAWEDRAHNIFNKCVLTNGVHIYAFPSTARQAKQGDPIDLIFIDEDIVYSDHVKEFQDRLSDKKGKLIWSVWPHSSNGALLDMSARAEEQKGWDKPMVTETVIRFTDNPYIAMEEKEKAWNRMGSENERRARDFGEFMFELVRMYDYDDTLHSILNLDDEYQRIWAAEKEDKWHQWWTKHKKFPLDWTRYLAIDPSHTRTAVLVGVIPPPEKFGDMVIIEREFILERKTADQCAKCLVDALAGMPFEAFIMDKNAGRMTAIGFGKTIKQQYAEAFEKHKLLSRMTHASFDDGLNDTEVRRNIVRGRLRPGVGPPTLRIVYETCPETRKEFKNFKKRIVEGKEGKVVLDEAAEPRKYDCMAAMEYLISYSSLRYVSLEEAGRSGSGAYRAAMRMLKKWSQNTAGDFVHFGPGKVA